MATHLQVFLLALPFTIYHVYSGNPVETTMEMPLHIWVPFDLTTLSNWYLYWFIQVNMGITYCLCVVLITSYFLTCCFYIVAACDHLKSIARSINDDVKRRQLEIDPIKRQQIYGEIKKKLRELVHLHGVIYE